MEPTLGQLKEYLLLNGIKIDEIENDSDKTQLYGDNGNAELYFQYYLEHSEEIHAWLDGLDSEKENIFRM